MNLIEATIQAEKKINSAEEALAVAIEMLEAIKDGHSYGSFEYLAALYRMRKFAPPAEIDMPEEDNAPDDEFSGDRDLAIGERDDEVGWTR